MMTDGRNIPRTDFDFLGYTFRPRRAKNKHGEILCFVSFRLLAIKPRAGFAKYKGMAYSSYDVDIPGRHRGENKPGSYEDGITTMDGFINPNCIRC